MTVMETARLRLRPLTGDDLARLHAFLLNPEFRRFLGPYPPPLETFVREQKQRWDLHFRRHGWGQWAVERKDDGSFVGRCGLIMQQVDGADEVEVAYAIGEAFWGRGFAAEAARGCRDWAFRNLPVPHVISLIHADNLRSARVAQANGMTVWKDAPFNGVPHQVFRITRAEWEAIQAAR
ncbi:MAG TPA: GNAT family N-acetyltransferase [Longimicrobium sp.]|nr:GNAT family N-acetyltransferase [Longimicrobium sp.]